MRDGAAICSPPMRTPRQPLGSVLTSEISGFTDPGRWRPTAEGSACTPGTWSGGSVTPIWTMPRSTIRPTDDGVCLSSGEAITIRARSQRSHGNLGWPTATTPPAVTEFLSRISRETASIHIWHCLDPDQHRPSGGTGGDRVEIVCGLRRARPLFLERHRLDVYQFVRPSPGGFRFDIVCGLRGIWPLFITMALPGRISIMSIRPAWWRPARHCMRTSQGMALFIEWHYLDVINPSIRQHGGLVRHCTRIRAYGLYSLMALRGP